MWPLVVDLDGTLIHTDMLHESVLRLLRDKPWYVFCIPFWLFKGKAALKQHLSLLTNFNPASLPYNDELLEWLKHNKSSGRTLVLCTASDLAVARSIADYLNIFDEVMASNGSKNLAGGAKADALEHRFGQDGFDYIGNSTADLTVWQRARRAVMVNAPDVLIRKTQALCDVEKVFPAKTTSISTWCRVLRVHQWLKNLLLFMPLIAAHQFTNIYTWQSLILAFVSFSLCASTVYIVNDLLDLESDRLHPRKCQRPFASGSVAIWVGVVLAPMLFIISIGLGAYVGGSFLPWLMCYFVLTCSYSLWLKRLILIDCLTLAILYTMRIVAGAAAASLSLSFWLLAFSVFLFISLAFVKRYAELEVQLQSGSEIVHGRGYLTSDAPLVQTLGIASGYASVLVLALYLNSEAVLVLYRTPEIVWGAVPIMMFWISWIWLQAHRGNMHDDPVVFALQDKTSLLAGVVFVAVLFIGTVGWSW